MALSRDSQPMASADPRVRITLRPIQTHAHTCQIERRDQFDRIVIETTGLANPAPIIQTFFIEESVAINMKLDGLVTLVRGALCDWL